MKDRSIVIIFTGSLIVLALIMLLVGVFLNRTIMHTTTPMFVSNISRKSDMSPKAIYSVAPEVRGDKYLVKFVDVICDGAMNPETGESSIFRLSFTIESTTSYLGENIVAHEKEIVSLVRSAIGSKSVSDMNGESNLNSFKAKIKKDINNMVPNSKVSEVYIEGLVGQ